MAVFDVHGEQTVIFLFGQIAVPKPNPTELMHLEPISYANRPIERARRNSRFYSAMWHKHYVGNDETSLL